ncbi:MAG: HAMP domain-containing sensor histidine kinase, partial [Candidatus Eisenbacteria bacterium]|nr:HAMP domain-containing sensor histidine kinase [Candidatus Eisenbacteria bacterium]
IGMLRFLAPAERPPRTPPPEAGCTPAAKLESKLHRYENHEFLRYSERLERLVRLRTERILELERERASGERQAAIGRMAARIAHEINNPLGGIRNCAILLSRAIPPDHPQAPYAGRMLREIDRVAAIIRQMYGLYRPDPGATGVASLDLVLTEVVETLESEAAATGLRLCGRAPAPDLRVRMRANELRQVLLNLVRNSIEASPAGAEIIVEAEALEAEVEIRVRDRGCGIAEAHRDRVFEAFYTTKTTGGPGGLGLGLAISRSLVAAARGSLTYTSTPGGETCFRIRLSRAHEEERDVRTRPDPDRR